MNLINLASWTWLFETINSLLLVICNWIYSLIGILYQVFEAISKVNLFDRLTFEKITSRIYVIMGVAMLFIFAYNIILMIINPEDKKTTGNTSKVVKETIISLVLVILLPTIFNYMYIFQNHVITSNILGQIILGPTGSTSGNGTTYDSTCDFSGYGLEKYQENHWFWPTSNTSDDEEAILKYYCDEYKNKPAAVRGAYSIAPTVLSAFYSPANFTFAQCVSYLQGDTNLITDSEDQQICINYFYDVTASKYTGNIKPFVYDTYLKNIASDSSKTNIEFNGIMAVVAGCLAVWMFLCYSMEIGVRVAKLGVLQIISPIAVMMRIIPKQKEAMFDKWLKQLINTYLDVFIRLLIIFFALFAISLVEGVLDNLFASLGTVQGSNGVATFGIRSLAAVIVILGILKFAQQAPDLLKEFFGGAGGNFSLNPKKVFDSRGIDAIRGGIYGATTGKNFREKLTGAFSGVGRGVTGGYDKAVKGIDTLRTEYDNGSRFWNRAVDRARVGIGMQTRAEKEDRITNRLNEKLEINSKDEKKLKEIKDMSTNAITKDTSKVKFTGFSFDGVDFSNMRYTQVKEYEDVLKSSYENAADDAAKKVAYQKLVRFQNEFGEEMKKKVNSGVDALIQGRSFYGDTFSDSDYAIAKSNIADVLANEHDHVGNIRNSSELKDALDAIGSDSRIMSNDVSNVTTREGYQARHADSRVVRGQGKAEKK